MSEQNKRGFLAIGIVVVVLVLDQVTKFLVKTNMELGEEFAVFGDWFKIHFVENNGMAFGAEFFAGSFGKLLLTLFRIVAVSAIGWYLCKLCRQLASIPLVAMVALVMAGAAGNIIDSVFYGVCFGSSWGQVAEFLPVDGGYGSILQGRVVDMLYFPLVEGRFPDWLPLWGGESFIFFRPVFNVADAAISVGIALLLIFEHKELAVLMEGGNEASSND